MGKKSAFSLAETLLAIGTISVIAILISSTVVGSTKVSKFHAAHLEKVRNDVSSVSQVILYEDCLSGEKLNSFSPIELRDAFASRMHVNATWDSGSFLRGDKEGALSVLKISKNDVSGMTLCNGSYVGFVSKDDIQCPEQKVEKKQNQHRCNIIELALWLLGFNIECNSSGHGTVETVAEQNLSKCLSDNGIRVDGTRELIDVLFIDVNGSSSPNRFNSDQYIIPMYEDGI